MLNLVLILWPLHGGDRFWQIAFALLLGKTGSMLAWFHDWRSWNVLQLLNLQAWELRMCEGGMYLSISFPFSSSLAVKQMCVLTTFVINVLRDTLY